MLYKPVDIDINDFIVEISDIPSNLIYSIYLPKYTRTWYGKKVWSPVVLWICDKYENNVSEKLIKLLRKTFKVTIKLNNNTEVWTIPEATIYDVKIGILSQKNEYIREIQVILKYPKAVLNKYE